MPNLNYGVEKIDISDVNSDVKLIIWKLPKICRRLPKIAKNDVILKKILKYSINIK